MATKDVDPDDLHRAENGLYVIEFVRNAPRTAFAAGTVAGFALEQAQLFISEGFAKAWHPAKAETSKAAAPRTV